jgi:hypothetical protein
MPPSVSWRISKIQSFKGTAEATTCPISGRFHHRHAASTGLIAKTPNGIPHPQTHRPRHPHLNFGKKRIVVRRLRTAFQQFATDYSRCSP